MKKIFKKLFYLKKLKYLFAGQAYQTISQGLFSFCEFSLELYLKNLILLQRKNFLRSYSFISPISKKKIKEAQVYKIRTLYLFYIKLNFKLY